MTSLDLLDRLLGHDRWATDWVLAAVRRLPDADLDREFDLGHRTLRATLEHLVGNVETWTGLMNGQPMQSHAGRPSAAELTARYDATAAAFGDTARTVCDWGRLNETYLDVLDQPPREKTFGGTILHVLTHSHMHRAEALHMLERLGVPDLIEGDMLGWEQNESQRAKS